MIAMALMCEPKLLIVRGIPGPINLSSVCRFRTRCHCAKAVCAEVNPPTVADGARN